MKTKLITILALVAMFGSCEKAEVITAIEDPPVQQRLPRLKCWWFYVDGHYVSDDQGDPTSTWVPAGSYFHCMLIGSAVGAASVTVADVIDTTYYTSVSMEVLQNNSVLFTTHSDSVGLFCIPDSIWGKAYDIRLTGSLICDTAMTYLFDTTGTTLHPIIVNPK
jgi:hypothetical protein